MWTGITTAFNALANETNLLQRIFKFKCLMNSFNDDYIDANL